MAPDDPELCELVKEMNRSILAERFREEKEEPLKAEGEIFPSSVLPALATNRAGERRVFPMKWGFSQNNRLLINARYETAADKPTFREAWLKHRCAIPVSWYFEWEHDEKNRTGLKYALRPEGGGLIWLAGLYRMEEDVPVFVILTRPAAESLTWIHDRMPVIFQEEEAGRWIRPNTDPQAAAQKCLKEIRWRKAV